MDQAREPEATYPGGSDPCSCGHTRADHWYLSGGRLQPGCGAAIAVEGAYWVRTPCPCPHFTPPPLRKGPG